MKIGIDLGGTNVRAGIVENGTIIRKIAEPCRADKSEMEVLDHITGMIRQLMTDDVKGIGIGVPSVVDAEHGIVYNVANIPSWEEVHLKTILEEEFHIPVAVNNDCNCFALGEYRFGEGAAYKDVVCVAMGTGVGAGIIIDGKLYMGSNTGSGEIGCLPYLDLTYEHYCGSYFFSQIHGITGKDAYDRAVQKDPVALKLWAEMGEHIGNLMNAILFTYDPQAIILSGSISNAYDFFSGTMYETMQKFPYPETIQRIHISVSKKEDIALLGASEL